MKTKAVVDGDVCDLYDNSVAHCYLFLDLYSSFILQLLTARCRIVAYMPNLTAAVRHFAAFSPADAVLAPQVALPAALRTGRLEQNILLILTK